MAALMRKSFALLFLFSMVFPLLLCAEVKGCHQHHFAVAGDYLLMKRTKSSQVSLVETAGNEAHLAALNEAPRCLQPEGTTLIDSQDLVDGMNYQSGVQASLRVFPTNKATWELRYLFPMHWRGIKKVSCLHNLTLSNNLGQNNIDYTDADSATTVYYSTFQTADLNYWKHITPQYIDSFSVSLIFGFRWLNLEEKLNLYFTKNALVNPIIPPTSFFFNAQGETSRYQVKTRNWAFGPQIGAALEYNPYTFLTWGFFLRFGALYNRGQQHTLVKDRGNRQVIFNEDPGKSNFAYLVEGFPYIELMIGKFLTFRVSYEFLYIGRMALADRQIDHGDDLNNRGNIIYKGLIAGLQFNF